ncbi:5-methyltetrahydropteroyltriglutamate-homocysteine methyltransferase [Colletotrichum karsti]|uniref:5-methyltetrahydropteroyltriglutamate-homocysteine methyltransferase n=1 Tax=Colletotrichum karsti TaxID=1095194 RepID=A0A9P6I142_9PEZI|nr:5-methyltetrahydropteroyltriglutamate-homocysteine methyltransferase [Colletotrichum karsti]KAF9873890.1 5-methyltetrahydropteroyltriglutamate-homocysteine methyltransferase [Colletotrichum karsti]
MGIPTELVGSLPRPEALQQAYADYDAGKILKGQLEKAQDAAVKDSINRLKDTGETFVNDGEQRASSFATYSITDTLSGTGLADGLAGDGQVFAYFDDGHQRQLPRLTKGPFRYQTYAFENFKKSQALAEGHAMKTAVISPSMLYLLYPLKGDLEGYNRLQFVHDLVRECEKDIRGCFAAGAKRVSIDFTEGRLTNKKDPRNPWTNEDLLQTFVDIINTVLDRFTPEERKNIGLHTCPGGDYDSVHSAEVPYHTLLPSLFKINAGYFLIQLSSEKDKITVYKEIGEHIRKDGNGVKQVAFIGVTNPLDPRVENPEEIANDLCEAAKYIPIDQLGATDDCGFSPFSIDSKPKYVKGPDFARDIAFQKISNRVKGAKIASEKLGV